MGALTPIETTPRRTAGRGMTSPSPSFQLREPPGQQVACQWCGKILTGPHAPGNLTRHQKSKECVSDRQRKEYTCSVEGCGRKYARSDGLRNHERKVHNAPGPARRNVPESPFRTDSNSGYVGHRLDDHPPGWPDL
ncbi:uncharacterized protein EI97DRAFT_431407 [Westerdykella ornata]|uniref:C2H2-type domain-containing protein n=1 Tax=Westerdykella ornata TaxID=318751 RepID=A0A6A6JQH3_WESOR|nr:uncharacterized protein EI97DRAFT_431407 [Westerdykella ornata]KAF2278148.1 hypothetical protein EI97DRAFT_431407 [Westerdykella ornata]